MDYLLLGRVAKIAALLGFLLPWVTVSCSGNEILTATGLQLMTGDPQPAGALEGMGGDDPAKDAEPAIAVIVACAVLAIGLAVSFLTKARVAAAALLVGGLGGAGVSYYAMQNMRTEMAREIGEAQNETPDTGGFLSERDTRQMTSAVANAIRVEEEEGYWLTVGASLIAALLGLMVLAGAGAAPVRRPEDPPPP
jgi:hypothetical protein